MKNNLKKNFTQVPNQLINDNTISRDARFLFVYLCTKDDNWVFRTSVIEKDLCFSKDTRIKYMKELVVKGWITTSQVKNDKGIWGALDIELNDRPVLSSNLTEAEVFGSGKIMPLNNTNNNLLYTIKDLYKNKMSDISVSDDYSKLYLKTKKEEIEIPCTRAEGYAFFIADQFRHLFIKNIEEKGGIANDQKEAKFHAYVNPILLIHKKGGYNSDHLREIYQLLDSDAGEFWKTVILSTSKLRLQMQKLILAKNSKHNQTKAPERN